MHRSWNKKYISKVDSYPVYVLVAATKKETSGHQI